MRVKLAAVNRRKALIGSVAAMLGAFALAGCPSTATTTGYTPITGILIRSTSLVAGLGCGTGADQIYKYGALISFADDAGSPEPPVFSGVFDCFSDGLFSNLPASDSGAFTFDLSIVAWNQASFPPALQCPPNAAQPCPGDDPGTLLADQGTPTWTTTCTATQQLGISVLAVCGPLVRAGAVVNDAGVGDASDAAAGAAITVDTHGFVLADGGTITCGSGFDTAQATYMVGSTAGAVSSVACPTPLTISPSVVGGAYSIAVELLHGATPVAQSACQATGAATTTAASCATATAE